MWYKGCAPAFQAVEDQFESGHPLQKLIMIPILDKHYVFERYDFSSTITDKDNNDVCCIVKEIVDSGNYFTNSPKYQTKENVFARKEPVWLKLRMSFLMSVFMYLGREVPVSNMMAWSFMTNLDGAEDRETLWHNHWHPRNPNNKMISGIYYVHIPDDVANLDTCGTEFAPNGLENPDRFYVRPQAKSWIVYPSSLWHRPGVVQSSQYRFIVAADVEVTL